MTALVIGGFLLCLCSGWMWSFARYKYARPAMFVYIASLATLLYGAASL